jgi:hypothetical protein
MEDVFQETPRGPSQYELTLCGAAPCILRRRRESLRERRMGLEERLLYHQAHPLKMVVDAGAGLGALVLFWAHAWGPAVVLGMGPPALASVLVLAFADLESVARTRLGRYVRRGMTLPVQLLRLGGYTLTGYGAWNHSAAILMVGLLLILSGWLTGAARRRGAAAGTGQPSGTGQRAAGAQYAPETGQTPAGAQYAPDSLSC